MTRRRLRKIWSPEETERLAQAVARHPATYHWAGGGDDRPLAPVVDLRTRERVQ